MARKHLQTIKLDKKNHVLILNTHKSINRECIEYFMNRVSYDYIYQMVEDQENSFLVGKQKKEFITKYFSLSFNAIVMDWIHTGMKEEPDNVAKNIGIMFNGDLKKSINKMKI